MLKKCVPRLLSVGKGAERPYTSDEEPMRVVCPEIVSMGLDDFICNANFVMGEQVLWFSG